MIDLEMQYIGACGLLARISQKLISYPIDDPQKYEEELILIKAALIDLTEILPDRFEIQHLNFGAVSLHVKIEKCDHQTNMEGMCVNCGIDPVYENDDGSEKTMDDH